jgi:hypothetical protein
MRCHVMPVEYRVGPTGTRRHGSCEPWRQRRFEPDHRSQHSCRYLATPFRPFGDPGSGVFKYGNTAK